MPIELACDRCGRGYRFTDEHAGLQFACQSCGSALRVPIPAVPVSLDQPEPQYELGEDGEFDPPPPPSPPPQAQLGYAVPAIPITQPEWWRGMVIPLAVGVLIFVIAVFAVFASVRTSVSRARAVAAQSAIRANPPPRRAPVAPPRVQPSYPVTRSSQPRYSPSMISPGTVPDVDVSTLQEWRETDDRFELGDEAFVGDFSIRLPKGWASTGDRTESSRLWIGRPRPGISQSPRVGITVRNRTDRDRRQVPAVLTAPGQSPPRDSGPVIYAPGGSVEYGLVNKIVFAKVDMPASALRRRIQYAAFDGESHISIEGTFDLRDNEGPRLLDAVVRTIIREKPPR
jgi:hypothetical protein